MSQQPDYDTMAMNWIGDWAGRRAALTPHRTAILDADSNTRLSYADVNARANRVGAWLLDEGGLKQGDPICIVTRNRVEALDLYMACGKIGTILAPLSYRLRPRELNELLERIQPRALVYEDVFDSLVDGLQLPDSVATQVRITDGDDSGFLPLLAHAERDMNRPLAQADPFLYIHTGGTTATPKVCIVPHRQMLWNALDMIVTGGTLMEQRQLITFPLFHVGGWNSLTPVFHAGGYSVLTRQFDPGQVLDVIEGERITNFGGVEAMLRFIAEHPRFPEADLSSVTGITSAGAPCSSEVMDPFYARGIPVVQAYGLTEAGPSNFMYGGIDQELETIRAHNRSIGTSMIHCDFRIVDQESGVPVPTGEVGVLHMRSLHNFGGYLGQPDRTRKALLDDGWVDSGDLAVQDEEGNVRIMGRADNMFISGGENVSPEEIETVLQEHPAVAQVCVVAMPDQRWGQVPVAAVVPADDAPGGDLEPDLRAHCREHLAAFKVPSRFAVVESIPVTGAGKIDRNSLGRQLES
ncbi:AMP-binding protein [Aquisalimonas sp.]|uniref:class I adenylate-forming enzyme family protein n=1 Tax=Aquisalimonas sp. TaxID=1872621 RepID=UPI0025C5A9D7|nr:AMP-binding protein [Aquisalimonas sp.]